MIKYLLFLGIGHILGDFYLQSTKKSGKKSESFSDVLWHALQYYIAFLLTAIPIFGTDMILAATYASAIHMLIDTVKYLILRKKKISKDYVVFLMDQGFHILSFFILADVMYRWNFTIQYLREISYWMSLFHCDSENVVKWLLAILLMDRPVNVFIQSFLGEYRPKTDDTIIRADRKAGRKIGTIERLIMLLFLSKDQFVAIGFVLTAKSVARYDKITKDEKFAEYYLLGTLVSTLCVILCRTLILP